MSWSLSVPKQETYAAFEQSLHGAKESPKADGRTSVGKAQKKQVAAAKAALADLAYDTGATAGYANGHVNPDLSGNISVGVTLSAP